MEFSLIFHYRGRFDRDSLVYYTRENEHVVEIDPDRWSLFKAIGIVKELTKLEYSEYWLWWYNNDDDKYSRMVSDSNVDKVYQYDMVMKCAVHIYVEHKGKGNAEEANVGDFQEDNVGGVEQVEEDSVGGVEQIEEANIGGVEHVEEVNVGDVEHVGETNVDGVEQVEDTEDNEDSDFEANGLSFDDSEDERAPGLDDCFDFIENQVEEKGKRCRIKVAARKHKHTPKKLPICVDNMGSCSGMDNEMIINYASDEICSSDTDASDGEKKPKYSRFKMQDLDKN
ncbi:unnamed protein product [Lathyrus oleraceus]